MNLLDGLEPLPAENRSTLGTEWYIAWSHLRSRQHAVLLNITTLLAVFGVIAGVAVLNCVIAVMIGFEQDLQEKLISSDAHVRLVSPAGDLPDPASVLRLVEPLPQVHGAAAYVEGEVMLRNSIRSTGVIVKGIDSDKVREVSDLQDLLVQGLYGKLETAEQRAATFDTLDELVLPALAGLEQPALPALFMGRTLQEQLLVQPGDQVQLINPVGQTIGMLGMPQPATRLFRVAGIFQSGQYEFDAKRVYVELELGRSFLQVEGATGIELKVDDPDQLDASVGAIRAVLPEGIDVLDWRDLNRTLFEALYLQRYVMTLLLSLTIGVAGLLIISTLFMVVITKRSEIAILKALGASNDSVRRVFVMHGVFVGGIGVLTGTVLGLAGCAALQAYGWPLDADIYALSTLPVVVRGSNVLAIAGGAFVACALATLIPSSAAASLDPVEGLRLD